jgi:hypothetical protein
MSYILDALKRADTERERGAVPGLHTRQLATPTGPTVPGARSSMWLGLAAAVALGGIGLGLWVWQKPADAPPPVALRPVVIQPPVAPPAAANTRGYSGTAADRVGATHSGCRLARHARHRQTKTSADACRACRYRTSAAQGRGQT